ncbi:hypothetical protein Tco_1423760, partial [Tanacetum coccineum]
AEASRVRNGYDSNGSGPRPAQATRECSYYEFLKCKPLDFKGIEGVNSYVKTTTPEAAHAMTWATLKKMMTNKYCPRDASPPLPTTVPTSSPPLLLPSASRREDRPEVTLPPRKRIGIALGPRYEVGESFAAAAARLDGGLRANYCFVATIDREIRRDPERYVGYGITDS